jgi:hypothetical protein
VTRPARSRPVADLRQHVLDLARAFDVRVCETTEIPHHGAAASVRDRAILCTPITDESLYAVALHELGHVLAPSGSLPGVDGHPARVQMLEEQAAWEWARHYALEWTPLMEQVAAYALSTYEAVLPTLPAARVRWEAYEPTTKGGRIKW